MQRVRRMVAQKTKDEFLPKQKNQFWAVVVLLKTKKKGSCSKSATRNRWVQQSKVTCKRCKQLARLTLAAAK